MTRVRGTCVAVAIAVAGLLVAVGAAGEPISQLHPSNYVNDFAHVLQPNTEAQLNDLCQQIDQKAKAQIAVVTINSLDGQDIESYAVDLYQKWGIGNKSTNRGVLILIAIKDHRYRTEVGYGLEPILPDGKVGGIWRESVPLLKRSDYDEAIEQTTQKVASVIAQDAGVQLTGVAEPPREHEPQPKAIPAGRIFFLIVIALIVLATPLRKVLFWWLLLGGGPRWGSGYRGGWGGGGFGGFGGGGGGGGFGGFGGGMSGGGGASGSW
ncbi:MAG TPA: TPM domain-containing protein [Terriglobales bacterium]|nr:TPM domain-containing protein [Terriglobales bacterium]